MNLSDFQARKKGIFHHRVVGLMIDREETVFSRDGSTQDEGDDINRKKSSLGKSCLHQIFLI
jgi:hypothetical protein